MPLRPLPPAGDSLMSGGRLAHDGLRLLAQELLHVVRARPLLPDEPEPFQPPKLWIPGQAPVVAPARFT